MLLQVFAYVFCFLSFGFLGVGMIFEPFSEISNWKVGFGAVKLSESLSENRTNFALHDELNGFGDLVGHNSATYIMGYLNASPKV